VTHRPVKDIHIGVVTSSLGDHGGDRCAPGPKAPTAALASRPGAVYHRQMGVSDGSARRREPLCGLNPGGRLRVIALITAPETAKQILRSLGMPTDPPPIARARGPDFDHAA